MSLANDGIELSYGELTMIKLEGFFQCCETPYAERKNLSVPTEFWAWRKENKSRQTVLNKAGLALNRNEDKYGHAVWTADLTNISADTLDEARDANVRWKRTEKEIKERARLYMRQCERMKYLPGGQFGGPA